MKRRDLLTHLARYGCVLLREGSRHSVFWNPRDHRTSTVPRHRDVHNFLAHKICRDLGIPSS
ncbi:MAG: type II toxin-antitoxin system HicA family toxin [Candidatus Uhrbacteria bacterium]